MPFMPGREASLLLGAAAAASLGAAVLYALTASEGAKQSSFSDFILSSGLLQASDEQPVDVSSAADTAQPQCQVTSPAATAGNGAIGAPAGNQQQAIDIPQPSQQVQLLEPAQSLSSAQAAAAAAAASDSDLQTRSAAQQLKPKPQQSTAHAEVQQPSHPCEDVRNPVQQQQWQSVKQQSCQALSPAQKVLNRQQVLQQQWVQQEGSHQQEGPHQQQDAATLEQQLQCAEQPHPQDAEEQSGVLQQDDACELDGEPDLRQQQQVTAVAAPPTPREVQQLQPPPAASLGPPSERDKAIMYRLSIDKSAWHDSHSNSGRSSTAGDAEESGRLIAESANCAAESPAIAVAGSSGGAAKVIAAFEQSISIARQASNSSPASPRSATTSPKVSGAGRQRQVLNTTRCQPSLDTTVSTAAVAGSLAVQYAGNSILQGLESHQLLSSSCAQLCKQHCRKLQEGAGELGETTALDIGCGTGGCCFELALSFSHVLGIDGDAMHVVAAKEMKDKGQLEYRPVLQRTLAAAADDSKGTTEAVQQALGSVCVARVAANCDRDNVRFWCYPLPELPPKLQSVDAVLVEDVEGRLASGLRRVCEQVPALLNPGGVCVVVLPGDCRSCDVGVLANGASEARQRTIDGHCAKMGTASPPCHGFGMQSVTQWLEKHELQFVAIQELQYPVDGILGLRSAVAGVWLQPK